jgi:hypothetical protein
LIISAATKKEIRAIVTGRGYLLKRFAQTAIRNAKFLLSPPETARYIARIVFPGVNREARLRENSIKGLAEKQILLKDSILIRSKAGRARGMAEGNQFPAGEKNALNSAAAKNITK